MTEGLNIAIVEDEKAHADVLSRFLERWAQERNVAYCIREFPSAEAFLFEWEQNQAWNALFFDIQMSGINGVELAKRIRSENRRISIVFVTGNTDYLLQGYEVEALHYLLKPVDADKIDSCMERILTRYREQEGEKVILMEARELTGGQRGNRVTLRLVPEDILYIEAFAHNTELHTKEKCYFISDGISEWRERLPEETFCTCHRSYLVNLFHVVRLERTAVILDDGRQVPLSKKSYRDVNQAFIHYYSRIRADGDSFRGGLDCEEEADRE